MKRHREKTRREVWTRSFSQSPQKEPSLMTPFSLPRLVLKNHDLGMVVLPPNVCPICYVMVPEILTEILTPLNKTTRTLANIH